MTKHFLIISLVIVSLIVCSTSLSQATTDNDVLSVIAEAVKQYNKGDLAGAASNLDYASQLIRQQKSERMKNVLPQPLAGWDSEAASAQAIGTAVLGGGVTVSREYMKDPSRIQIEIVSDSPVLQSVLMMLNNPMFAGASGGKLELINGQRAIVKYDEQNRAGDITIAVAGKLMVTVKGQYVEQSDLVSYARLIDYKELDK